ncbi:MAG: TIGR03905 family TSCPD domain-containing protein [Spirochaetaceae bacterium]|nr:TIGR03905 family TSCPD domain-containing protein [Spirochaetaceae bacterium]
MTYKTTGTCAQHINFDIEDGKLHNVQFIGGCMGNLKAISRLIEGMPIEEAVSKLEGLDCKGRGTSCSDQLTKAIKEALNS